MPTAQRKCCVLVSLAATLAIASAARMVRANEPYLDVIISELMYHAPQEHAAAEFVEITNRGTQAADLAGWSIRVGINYTFPAGTTLAPGQHRIVAKSPAVAATTYGLADVLGPYDGNLSRSGERLELRDHNDGLVCEVVYETQAPWPAGGRGDGRSIELVNLAANGNVGRFWRPSSRLGGTPGAANLPGGTRPVTVVINEFVARSSIMDRLELYNYGDVAVDLNGYYLTDRMDVPTRARISPAWSGGTIIPPKGFWTSTEADWSTFALSADGEAIFLVAPDGVTWVDGVEFGAQPVQNASEGRYPDGGERWCRFLAPTLGAANQAPADRGVVINEIMYHPPDETDREPGAEYVEVHNRNAHAVNLAGWALSGGVNFAFPSDLSVPAGGFVVVARDPARVQNQYGLGSVLGPYGGKLSNKSEPLALNDELGNTVDEVEYRDRDPWPEAPDGQGPSLERANEELDSRLPGAWRASLGNGTPGQANSVFIANPAASIGDDVQHSPLVPTSTQAVTVTARIGAGNLTGVTLFHKRDIDATWNPVTMYDDGQHGDGLAGDGVYGGILPARANNSVIEFYIQAAATGGTTRFPSDAPARTCLYLVENTTPNSNLNVFRIVITQANHNLIQNNPNSDVRRDCTFIFGRAYYNCSVRRRGGSRDWAKHSYKLHLTPGHRFRDQDQWDINFEKNDKTLLKNLMIYNLIDDLGQPGSATEFVHTRWRNTYAGVHLLTEPRSGDFLRERFPDDADGNLYKAIAPWVTQVAGQNIAWHAVRSWLEKQSNEAANDWSDLEQLHQITRPAFPQAQYESEVRRVADVVNWARSYAVLGVGCLIDQPWHIHNQNYRLYRRFSDNRIFHLLHDFDDAYWPTMWNNAGLNASVYADVNRFLNHPPFQREFYHAYWRALNLTDGVYREARARAKVAYHHRVIYNDVLADPFSGGTGDNRRQEFINARNQWDTWLNGRNALLRGQLPAAVLAITTNAGQPITTASPQLVLEGTAPLSAARLEIDGAETNIEWLSAVQWRRTIALVYQSSNIVVRTLDDAGNELDRLSVAVTYTGGVANDVDFSADVVAGPAPLTVQFTDLSTLPDISARLWEFGDGATSTQAHPSHTYRQDGVYTVRLTVVTPAGPMLEQKTDLVQVGIVPQIVNPSFENPTDFLHGWSSCLAGESVIRQNPSTHVTTPRYHDGQNSAGMSSSRTGDQLGAGAIWQQIAVTPGRTYRIRFHGYITASENDWSNEFLQLRVRDGAASALTCAGGGAGITANSTLLFHQPGTTGGWNLLEGQITPTQPVLTLIAYWEFRGTVWAINSLHIDDWSIQDLTPEAAPPPLPAMAVTEYLYAGSGSSGGEFVEFTNIGFRPVSMVGWSFDDSNRVPGTVDLSAFGIVQPGRSVVLTEDAADTFRAAWNLPHDTRIIGNLGNPIGHNLGRNDEINLYDASQRLVDRLTYGDQSFPGSIRTNGVSGWVQPHGLKANAPLAWVRSQRGDLQGSWASSTGDLGSPGFHFITRPGDLNGDGWVNEHDLQLFLACATGPGIPYDPQALPPGCDLIPEAGLIAADFDGDLDVDGTDFGILQRCWTGELPAPLPDFTKDPGVFSNLPRSGTP